MCARLPLMAVLVCTGPSSVAQRVRALRLGADDWIGKPCHPEELLARVEAVVRRRRRAESPRAGEPVAAGGLEIRADKFQVLAGAVAVDLTRREFELIGVLVEAEGQVLQREEIYHRVWGYEMVRGDRSVDVFVRKLRQKLERASPGWRYIHTHFGIGYRFAAEPVEAITVPAPADRLAAFDTVAPQCLPPVPEAEEQRLAGLIVGAARRRSPRGCAARAASARPPVAPGPAGIPCSSRKRGFAPVSCRLRTVDAPARAAAAGPTASVCRRVPPCPSDART